MKLFATLLALAAFSLIAQGVGKYLAYTWAMPSARALSASPTEPLRVSSHSGDGRLSQGETK